VIGTELLEDGLSVLTAAIEQQAAGASRALQDAAVV